MANLTINNVRISYANLTTPKAPMSGGAPVYSCVILLPKSDAVAKKALDEAVEQAKQFGASSKWAGKIPSFLNIPIHDGDGQKPRGGEYGEECRGMWVINAKANLDHPPFIVDGRLQPILNPADVYSGMWANVSLSLYPFAASGNNGVGVGINGLQKTRDDAPLGGGVVTAEMAFGVIDENGNFGI